jgi:ABC-2 type transport system permease protein
VLWLFALTLFGSPAGELMNDAQTGTLEQWLMSGPRPVLMCVYRTLGGFLQSILFVLLVLVILILITGVHLNFTPIALIPITSVLLSAFGLGLGLAAYAMLVKRATVLISISQFLIFFLIAAPVDEVSGRLKALALLLPMASAAGMVRDLIARQSGITFSESVAVVANGLIYLCLGAMLLEFATRIAKKRGTIGNY